MKQKNLTLTGEAKDELKKLCNAITEILDLTGRAFAENDLMAAAIVEPLEEVIDKLKEKYRSNHIKRLQRGDCTIDAGFVWSDILTDLERVSDHCSNIALSLLDGQSHVFYTHESVRADRELYNMHYDNYVKEYLV